MLELINIHKSFFGNPVLIDVGFKAYPGEIVAVLGQNGAGKSTLMKILGGVYTPDQGKILINGREVKLNSPIDAEKNNIAIVYQELSGIPHLTVSSNIVIGKDLIKKSKKLDIGREIKIAQTIFERLNITDISLNEILGNLSVSSQQICEIAKCIFRNPKIVIFDEPTTSLGNDEREKLFKVIKKMREDGLIILYVTHFLEEAVSLADKCLVLKDGRVAYYGKMEEINQSKLVNYMVGYKVDNFFPEKECTSKNKIALELRHFGGGNVHPVNLKMHYGEIVGLSGLIGSGRSELAHMIIGARKPSYGEIYIDGNSVKIRHPYDALKKGIALISEDRKNEGLHLTLPVKDNCTLPSIVSEKKGIVKRGGFISKNNEHFLAKDIVDSLKIKCSSLEEEVLNLSGGNQQKVSIGKWVATNLKVYIFDEPTKGIDIEAKAQIYRILKNLAKEGSTILVISSYNPEVINICHRIYVMSRGKIVKLFNNTPTEHELMLAQQA